MGQMCRLFGDHGNHKEEELGDMMVRELGSSRVQ